MESIKEPMLWNTLPSKLLILSSFGGLIQVGVKRVIIVLVKKNSTKEFDFINIFNKFGADICQT